mmetsp:Transcript_47333/g.112575  ORF Transcript_47333/g.112575 Transcript_47333/m.112575 type:complete len:767 (+) Transcript_47333:217-2517(+)
MADTLSEDGSAEDEILQNISEVFGAFSKDGHDMDGKSFAKLCRDCRLLDKNFTATEADIIFARHKKQRRIGPEQFLEAMKEVAEKKGVSVAQVCRTLQCRGEAVKPVLRATMPNAVRFHDDKSTYTGTHKNGGPDLGPLRVKHDLRDELRRGFYEVPGDLVGRRDSKGNGTSSETLHRHSSAGDLDEDLERARFQQRLAVPASPLILSSAAGYPRAASVEPPPRRASVEPPRRGSGHIPPTLSSSSSTAPPPTASSACSVISARGASPRPGDSPRGTLRANLGSEAKKRPPCGDSQDMTMIFTDVQGSTSLWEADPIAMQRALRLHDTTIRRVLAAYNGYEVTTEGDAFQLAFHDAFDAIRFCLELQRELLHVSWPLEILQQPDAMEAEDRSWRGLRVRMGVHSGRPLSTTRHEVTGRTCYHGPFVALAKAIEDIAHGGQILTSSACFSQFSGSLAKLGCPEVVDLGTHILKGSGLGGGPDAHGSERVRILQLTPRELASNPIAGIGISTVQRGGRSFPRIKTVKCESPSYHDAPAGPSITICCASAHGLEELSLVDVKLWSQVHTSLKECMWDVMCSTNEAYFWEESDAVFKLAFGTPFAMAKFATMLQQRLAAVQWPPTLRQIPQLSEGVRMSIGSASGHAGRDVSKGLQRWTGRAYYTGPVVDIAQEVAVAAQPGQVLHGVVSGRLIFEALPPSVSAGRLQVHREDIAGGAAGSVKLFQIQLGSFLEQSEQSCWRRVGQAISKRICGTLHSSRLSKGRTRFIS